MFFVRLDIGFFDVIVVVFMEIVGFVDEQGGVFENQLFELCFERVFEELYRKEIGLVFVCLDIEVRIVVCVFIFLDLYMYLCQGRNYNRII